MKSFSQANVGYADCVAGGLFVERTNEGEKQQETALYPRFRNLFLSRQTYRVFYAGYTLFDDDLIGKRRFLH